MSNRILIFVCTCFFAVTVHAGTVRQWVPATGGSWNTPANWSGGAVPVAGDTADFSNVNITADAVVTLDANQAVDAIIFGDTNTSTAGSWIINPGSVSGATITLSGVATITVNALGTGKSAQLNVPLAGTSGLTKAGAGTLALSAVNTYSGSTIISGGTLSSGLASVVANSGFEAPVFGAGAWMYNPSGGTWTFNAGSGIARNASPWVSTAPEGSQAGFIQNSNNFSQALTLGAAGIYKLTFKAANRPTYPDSGIAVQFDGSSVQTYAAGTFASGGVFNTFTVNGISLTSGAHTLTFVGTQSGVDSATAIDQVSLVNTSAGSLPSATAVNITASGASLDLTGGGQVIASLTGVAGSSVTNAGLLTVGDGTDTTFRGVISGTGALTKAGAGTLTLTGANTFTGTTTISAGTLQIGDGVIDGSLSTSTSIVDNAALIYNVIGSSQFCGNVISGTGSLTKLGTGTLTLGAANTYAGATVVSAGALKLQGIPSVVGLNYFKITGDSDSLLSNSNIYTHAINPSGGNEVVNSIPFTGAGVGSVSSLTSKTYTQPSGTVVTIANSIGASDFGALSLGTNTNLNGWSGVTGQMLNFFGHFNYNTAPLRTVVLNGLQSNIWYDVRLYEKQWDTSVGRTFSVGYNVGNDASTEATSPTIDQNHPESTTALSALGIGQQSAWAMSYVFKTGAAQTSIALAINNNAAATYHFYGLSNQAAIGGDNRLPITTALSIAAGATLDLGGGNQQVASLSNFGGGGGNVINGNSQGLTFTLNPASGSTTFSGVIGGGSGITSLIKSGNGTQILSGTNTYTGSTTISAGTLQIGDGLTDGSVSASSTITDNAALVFNAIGSTQSYSNGISGTGSLTKSGVGTLTLSTANTYGGATTVNGGTLLCTNTTGSATGTGSVTVNVNSTIAGTGTISGSLIVNGGIVSPGNGGAGTLTTGSATFNAASTIVSEVGTATDLLVVQGSLTIDGTVNVSLGSGAGAGVYTLVSYSGALTDNVLVAAGATPGYTPTVVSSGGFVSLTLNAGTATTLAATPVSPSVFGQSVVISATVSPIAPAVGSPTGSVVFLVDGVAQAPQTLVNGSASLSISTLSVGAHTIQANYLGVSTFGASTISRAHNVNKASTTLILATNANPSPDGFVTITAAVVAIAPGGGVPTGTVSITVDGVAQPATTLVNGIATLQITLDSGSHTILGQYSGSLQHNASNGTLTELVKPSFTSPPTLTPNPAVTGQPITATVGVGSAVVTWTWGDGTSATGTTASHTYSAPGIYTAIVTATAGSETITQAIQVFIGSGLQGVGSGAAIPGVTGILVGGAGAGTTQGGSGKIICNYVKREKTTYSGSLGSLALPATLTQDQLTAKNGTLILGSGALAQQFSFILSKNGRGRSTGLPQISFSVKKKSFKFKAQRSELTNLTEALGAPRQFGVKKGQVVTLLVPAILQIEKDLFIAMTFQVKYQQINSGGGKGSL